MLTLTCLFINLEFFEPYCGYDKTSVPLDICALFVYIDHIVAIVAKPQYGQCRR